KKSAAKKSAAKKELTSPKKSGSAKAAPAPATKKAEKSTPSTPATEKIAQDEPLYAVPDAGPAESATPEPEPSALPSAPMAAGATQDLSSLTVAQLRVRARETGHAGFSRYTKAQLIALLSS
ncbi:MAG: hypothetical protein ACXWZG_09065, partial [Microbacterium sp.]